MKAEHRPPENDQSCLLDDRGHLSIVLGESTILRNQLVSNLKQVNRLIERMFHELRGHRMYEADG